MTGQNGGAGASVVAIVLWKIQPMREQEIVVKATIRKIALESSLRLTSANAKVWFLDTSKGSNNFFFS